MSLLDCLILNGAGRHRSVIFGLEVTDVDDENRRSKNPSRDRAYTSRRADENWELSWTLENSGQRWAFQLSAENQQLFRPPLTRRSSFLDSTLWGLKSWKIGQNLPRTIEKSCRVTWPANMTVKVEDTYDKGVLVKSENSEVDTFSRTGASTTSVGVSAETLEDDSNNNQNTSQNSSLDSVVQRLIHKKMGRRKQNCPQRTGNLSEEGKQLLFIFCC